LRKEGEEEGVIQSSTIAFLGEAAIGRIPLEDVEGHVADDGHILSSMAGAQAGLILAKDDIQDPMQVVFDGPVLGDGVKDEGRISGQAADVEV